MKTVCQINLLSYSILDMKDASSSGSADDGALLADGKKLDDLRNALESGKDQHQIDAMKKVIGYIAKGNLSFYTRSFSSIQILTRLY
jgi:vesicle coat complex subunit